VVLVGAQRPTSALGTDAGGNLLCAIRTAASPNARGLGVLVALNDEIQAARDVMKSSTYRLQTFRTPDFGVLGHSDGDGVYFYRKPLRKHYPGTPFRPPSDETLPRVDIVPSYAGADGVIIEACVKAGAKGLISAGMAPGIPARAQREAFEHAAANGIVAVQSSRAGSGRVARRGYLAKQKMVGADNLSPQKARILLTLALTKTRDTNKIQEFFWTY
jgi:L-asparaginase